jgi:hypothetical protein
VHTEYAIQHYGIHTAVLSVRICSSLISMTLYFWSFLQYHRRQPLLAK